MKRHFLIATIALFSFAQSGFSSIFGIWPEADRNQYRSGMMEDYNESPDDIDASFGGRDKYVAFVDCSLERMEELFNSFAEFEAAVMYGADDGKQLEAEMSLGECYTQVTGKDLELDFDLDLDLDLDLD